MSLIRELMISGNIDDDYLRRYTNDPWLVIRNPGAEDDGLFYRDADGHPQVLDRKTGAAVPHQTKNVSAAMHGEVSLDNGGVAVPAFVIISETYMLDSLTPESVSSKVGISPGRIRQFAADLAEAAFPKKSS